MKHLLYLHAAARPLAAELWRAVTLFLSRWVRPHLTHLLPGPRGRRVTAWLLFAVGLVLQAFLLWLLGEIVSIAIDVMHLWAVLAQIHLSPAGQL